MCGRYQFNKDTDTEEIWRIMKGVEQDALFSGFSAQPAEICPSQYAPVAILQKGKITLRLMTWGFPKWDGKGLIINARSETVDEKPLFAPLFSERRCVILSTGFFEWRRNEKGRALEKYHFAQNNSDMLYMAGLYNTYHTPEGPIEHYVIFTCPANVCISDIHDRMPVILEKEEIKAWLRDMSFARSLLKRENAMLKRSRA